ncbi:oxygen-evolving enhancer protein 3-2, chloroplastic [Ricinus communis]|uniref:16 kDa subunit of oxygen evolving system of photosystem II n=1 Tax=Ricinus communis TaxID=3988 RepID=B9RXV2_RICCO|nr:oxygen-evolving enhancer protein 3-2, chloroplastic [Ricinus communis]EEF43958.1 Oxygen-evolving enhancer protein 3, chloroplast precursor, putative [Ricinus communis]|eukprot:XP_002518571.1 oxygen-evolving enhancer protein 3-2, chloroplastic [Ricinus communis]
MAQAMASMAGLRGNSQTVLEGSLQLSGSTRLNVASNTRVGMARPSFTVRAQQQQVSSDAETSRRAVLGLVAAGLASVSSVQAVLADAIAIKVGPPPPPSGGLPGTLNSDEARDLEKPLKERFYLQPQDPSAAVARTKESAKEIVGVKQFIDKKAWPYVINDLRLRAEYLRYDLKTIISAKPKDQKQPLKELSGKLFDNISELDHAAKIKSTPEAEKYYAQTVSTLNDILAKIG